MQFHREQSADLYLIRALDNGAVQIGEQWYSTSMIVTPQELVTDWPPTACETLEETHFDTVWQLAPELVLLGTGQSLSFPPPVLLAAGPARGIGLEVMDTAAACRTYNILAHEGRRVAAALILPAP